MDIGKSLPPGVPRSLADILSAMPKAGVAFSGGVDSSYLLYAAHACGLDVHAYCVHSQFQPQFELEDARGLARQVGADMTVLPVDVLAQPVIAANPADRCYHCKRAVFSTILAQAQADGRSVMFDGSNASDDADDRPGMRALQELGVRSPLREAGMTKAQVRQCAREAGLPIWDKPAYACLATRVPTGIALDGETLRRVEAAEGQLAQLGFSDFRVRVLGDGARLQLIEDQIQAAVGRRGEIVQALAPWFADVLLDLVPRTKSQ